MFKPQREVLDKKQREMKLRLMTFWHFLVIWREIIYTRLHDCSIFRDFLGIKDCEMKLWKNF